MNTEEVLKNQVIETIKSEENNNEKNDNVKKTTENEGSKTDVEIEEKTEKKDRRKITSKKNMEKARLVRLQKLKEKRELMEELLDNTDQEDNSVKYKELLKKTRDQENTIDTMQTMLYNMMNQQKSFMEEMRRTKEQPIVHNYITPQEDKKTTLNGSIKRNPSIAMQNLRNRIIS